MSESLSGTFYERERAKERESLLQFMQEEMAKEATGESVLAPAPMQGPPPGPAPSRMSAITGAVKTNVGGDYVKGAAGIAAKGLQGTFEGANAGAGKILNGLATILLKAEAAPETKGKPLAEFGSALLGKTKGVKDLVDGFMELVTAPGFGAAEAFKEFRANLVPGADQLPVFGAKDLSGPGAGGVAQLVRALAGAPTFKPNMTKEERAAATAPLTIGEVLDLGTILATTHYGAKIFKSDPRQPQAPASAAIEPEIVSGPRALTGATVDQRALGPGVYEQPGRVGAQRALPAYEEPARAVREFRDTTPAEITLENKVAVDSAVLDPQGRPVAIPEVVADERARLRAFERTPLDEPSRVKGEAGEAAKAAPEGELQSALDRALEKTGGVIEQVKREAMDAVNDDPDGFAKFSAALDEQVSATLEVFNESTHEVLGRMWLEATEATPGKRIFVRGGSRKSKFTDVIAEPSTYPKYLDQLGYERTRKGADKLAADIDKIIEGDVDSPQAKKLIRYANEQVEVDKFLHGDEGLYGEGGRVNTDLLARVAVGALLGCATGESPEECIRNGLLGAGVGAALSRKMAPRLAEVLKDEEGAFKLWGSRPKVNRSNEPYQPNYNRIAAEADVKAVMKNVHRAVADEIETAMRTPTPLRETKAEGANLIRSGKVTIESVLRGDTVDTEMLPAYGSAVRDLNVGAANEVVKVAQRIAKGEPVKPGELHQAIAVSALMAERARVFQTRSGQTLSAMRIKATPAEDLVSPRVDPNRVADIADSIKPGASEAEVAQMVMAASKDPATVAQFARLSVAIPRAIGEALYGSLLSGTALVTNAFNGAIMAPIGAWNRTLAAYMPTWGAKGQGVMKMEGPMGFRALWQGWGDQLALASQFDPANPVASGKAYFKALKEQAREMGSTQLDRPDTRVRHFNARTWGTEGTPLEGATNMLGHAVNAAPDLMEMTDGAVKFVNGRAGIAWEAYRKAVREGKEGPELWQRVAELEADYAKLDASALRRIAEYREEMTFTKDLEGRLGAAIQAGPENDWGNLVYRVTLATFVRTPLRALETGAAMTPGLNLVTPMFIKEAFLSKDPVKIQTAQARVVTGGIIMGTAVMMALDNLVTGPAPRDPGKRKIWEAADYEPDSFWDPVSGKWRSHKVFGPISTLLSSGAQLARYIRHADEFDWTDAFWAVVFSQMDTFDTRSYTQAFSQTKEIITRRGSEEKWMDDATKYVRDRLGMFIPAALAQLETLTDPAIRREHESGKYERDPLLRNAEAMLRRLQSRVPFWSDEKDDHGNDVVPPERNMLTGEVMVNETFPYNPFRGRTPKQSVVFAELMRLNGAGLEELPWIIGGSGVPAQEGTLSPGPLKPPTGVMLTPQERDRWIVLMTQGVRKNDKTLHDSLEELITSEKYRDPKRTSDLRRQEQIKERWHEFRERAEQALRSEAGLLDAEILRRQGEVGVQRSAPERQTDIRQRLHQKIEQRRQRRTPDGGNPLGTLAQ